MPNPAARNGTSIMAMPVRWPRKYNARHRAKKIAALVAKYSTAIAPLSSSQAKSIAQAQTTAMTTEETSAMPALIDMETGRGSSERTLWSGSRTWTRTPPQASTAETMAMWAQPTDSSTSPMAEKTPSRMDSSKWGSDTSRSPACNRCSRLQVADERNAVQASRTAHAAKGKSEYQAGAE